MNKLLSILGFISVINGINYQLIGMDDKETELLLEHQQENFSYAKTLKGHNDCGIKDIVFDPKNSNKLFSLSSYALKIWDIKKSSCIKTFTLKENNFRAESLAIGSDGSRVAVGGINKVLLYDNNIKHKEVTLSDGYQFLDEHKVRGLAFVPENNDIVVTCFDGNLMFGRSSMNVITIMNIMNETKNIIQDTIGWLRDMTVSPYDKKTIIIASMENTNHHGLLSFYDIESSQKKATSFASSVYRIACNPKEEHTFATCAWQSPYITLWDIRMLPKVIKHIETDGYKCMENIGKDVTFLPDGKTIAVSSVNRTQLYDISSGKCIQKLPNVYSLFHALNCCSRQDTGQHTSNISGTKASPDGNKLVTYSDDNTIKIWQKDND